MNIMKTLRPDSHLPLTVTLMLNTLAHAQILFNAFLPKHTHHLGSSPLKLYVKLKIKSKDILRGALPCAAGTNTKATLS